MAIAAHVVLRGISKEQYDQVCTEIGWRERHPTVGSRTSPGGRARTGTAWAPGRARPHSRRSGKNRLRPAITKLGIEVSGERTLHRAHEVYTPRSVTLT